MLVRDGGEVGVLRGDFSGGIFGFEARASASLKTDDIFEHMYCIVLYCMWKLVGVKKERKKNK